MIRVTCSILCYNYGQYLSKAIESCLNQERGCYSLEVIVIDDGSTDNTPEICSHYADLIKYYRSSNEGFASSLTKAIQYANGDYVFLLDADDYFAPTKISAMLPLLQQGKLYVSDQCSYIDEFDNPLNKRAWGSTSTVAVNKNAVKSLLPVENELSFFTLYKLGRGAVLSSGHTFYRFHNKSMTDHEAPGKWQRYLAIITHNLAHRLIQLTLCKDLPAWDVTKRKIIRTAYEFKSRAYYNELEAALELRQILSAYKKCMCMIYWGVRAGNKVSIFYLKMFVRTLIVRPSFNRIRG